ncbi:EamA family transporter [Actinomadura parmotrematis]|uniref:EamA family transporter n=1 Tax=Actinomadura parmotrematis TaxID=2864039 RepID=UPI0027E2EE78|nr:EamA family transporter [Actinomadura parmotrematis]
MPAGLLIGIASALCFGLSGPLARLLIDDGLSPMQVVWLRLGGAAVVLLAVARPSLRVPRGRRGYVVLYTLLGFALVQACYYAAVARLPVGLASLLEYAAPVLVAVWVRLVRGVRLPRAALGGMALTMAGLVCVTRVWDGLSSDALGLLFGLGTAAGAAAYFLLAQDSGDGIAPLTALAWGLIGSTAVLTPLARPWDLPWDALDGRDLLALGLLVGVATLLAYITGMAAVRRLTSAVGAAVASLEAVTAALLAWAVLGQALTPVQIGGGLVVLLGALLVQQAVARAQPRRADEPREAADRDVTHVTYGAGHE